LAAIIDSTAITNAYNEGAAHLARFLAYAEAESRGGVGGGPVLNSLGSADGGRNTTSPRSAVATELAEALRDRGLSVDAHVGRSGFRIDLAVRGASRYRLGVLIEPGTSGTTVTARAIAEAGVLRSFGWPIARVLVTEWWSRPEAVVARIERLLAETQSS
jgi:REase_MTES_1575